MKSITSIELKNALLQQVHYYDDKSTNGFNSFIISLQLMPQQMYSQTSENKVECSKNMQQPVLDANFM